MEHNDVHENGSASSFEALIEDSSRGKSKDHGWVTVVPKRRNKQAKEANSVKVNGDAISNGDVGKSSVYQSLEQHAEERRKKTEAQKAALAEKYGSEINDKHFAGSDDDSDADVVDKGATNNGAVDGEKKVKPKKQKKPKVTLPEAANNIDASHLADFLVEITASFENAHDVQLMRFADYFARALSTVNAAQFPLDKLLKESPATKLAEIPLCYIPEAVQKIAGDWINQHPSEALNKFTLWALSSVIEDLVTRQTVHKGSKHHQPVVVKGKLAMFVVLAMVLRRRPDVLLQLSPTFKTEAQFQGQDKLPMIVWAISQACQGDLVVGMSLWVQNLLPVAAGKKCSPLTRDLILQMIESCILGNMKKARSVLLNSAVRKGERLVPPSALNILMEVSFPLDSAKTKAAERFAALYPFVKEIALAGSNRSKSTKPVAQQLLPFSLTAISEENPALTNEAAGLFIWCLSQNPDCYKQWEKLHIEHLKASTTILEKLCADWKSNVSKLSPLDDLKKTLKSLRSKHEHALESQVGDPKLQVSVKAADKYCKTILGRLSVVRRCVKTTTVTTLLAVLIAICIILAMPYLEYVESAEWKRLASKFSGAFKFF